MAQMPPSHWEAYTQRCGFQRKGFNEKLMTAVGFEPTQLALVELESTPLDHSGKLSLTMCEVGHTPVAVLLAFG